MMICACNGMVEVGDVRVGRLLVEGQGLGQALQDVDDRRHLSRQGKEAVRGRQKGREGQGGQRQHTAML